MPRQTKSWQNKNRWRRESLAIPKRLVNKNVWMKIVFRAKFSK